MREVMIADAVRTPVGLRNGVMSVLRPDDTMGKLIDHLLTNRVGLDPSLLEDFICGCVTQIGEQGLCIARNALLIGGLPVSVPGMTVNRQEGSSLQAIAAAAQAIASGEMDVVLAGGVEFMSRQPMGSDGFGDHISHLGSGMSPKLFERFGSLISEGLAAELMAEKWGFSREDLDAYGKRSNDLAASAAERGCFAGEIMTLEITHPEGFTQTVTCDEGPMRGVKLEEMAVFSPSYKSDGIITPANSAQPADGAAAVLLMAAGRCSELGVRPLARYVATCVTGGDPVEMLNGSINATSGLLDKTGMGIADIDVFEINESFATVPLAWIEEFDPPRPDRLNPWGGAIANGNPLGASGARLTCSLLSELEYYDGRYALQAMSMERGMGIATIYERVP